MLGTFVLLAACLGQRGMGVAGAEPPPAVCPRTLLPPHARVRSILTPPPGRFGGTPGAGSCHFGKKRTLRQKCLPVSLTWPAASVGADGSWHEWGQPLDSTSEGGGVPPAPPAATHPAWNKSPRDCFLLPWGLKNTMILIIC